MKSVFLASLLFAIPAFAAPVAPVKTCSTVVKSPKGDKFAPTLIEVFEDKGALKAKYTQTIDGQTRSLEEAAEISEHAVRAGLSPEANPAELNIAETLIVHAMTLAALPELKDTQNAGLDLKAVRSAKIYRLGKTSSIGLSAIVEAKGQDGNPLGSFIGGFLVSPCQ